MSKYANEINVLTHGEVQKKIIQHPPKLRAQHDILGPGNKYRDEINAIYNRKREKFLDICKQYNRLNHETMICNKTRTLNDYREALDCQFLDEEDELEESKEDEEGAKLLRKRTERRIHEVKNLKQQNCVMESWVQRHLKLNKFIWAARTVVLRNRLLKVLAKLKTVTPEDIEVLEKIGLAYYNVSYPHIFKKFV